jgi:hypothetical protein
LVIVFMANPVVRYAKRLSMQVSLKSFLKTAVKMDAGSWGNTRETGSHRLPCNPINPGHHPLYQIIRKK